MIGFFNRNRETIDRNVLLVFVFLRCRSDAGRTAAAAGDSPPQNGTPPRDTGTGTFPECFVFCCFMFSYLVRGTVVCSVGLHLQPIDGVAVEITNSIFGR